MPKRFQKYDWGASQQKGKELGQPSDWGYFRGCQKETSNFPERKLKPISIGQASATDSKLPRRWKKGFCENEDRLL